MKAIHARYYPIFIFLISFCYFAISICIGFNIYDEAITLVGANSIRNGLIPYKDFWTMYAPGQFYFIAILFSIFTPSLLVERIFTILILSLFILSFYFLIKRYSSEIKAVILSFILTIVLGYIQIYARSLPVALLLIIISIIYFSKFLNNNKLSSFFFCGIITAITTLFRHDFGIYLVLSYSIVLIISFIIKRKQKTSTIKAFLSQIALFYLGIVIILAPAIIYFIANVPVKELYSQLFEFQLNVFPEYRSLPKPIPFISMTGDTLASKIQSIWFSLTYYIPLIIYILSIISIVIKIKEKNINNNNQNLLITILLILLGLFLYNQALIRADFEHLFPTLAISLSLLAFFDSFFIKIKQKTIISTLFILFLAIIPIPKKIFQLAENFDKTKYVSLNSLQLNCVKIPSVIAIDYQAIIDFIEDNSGVGERIFICNKSHEKILLNDLMLYFALNRQPSVKYYELHPGLATTDSIQKQIIEELERKATYFIIIRKENDEQDTSSIKNGVNTLDLYIQSHYKTILQLINYDILIRKNSAIYEDITTY